VLAKTLRKTGDPADGVRVARRRGDGGPGPRSHAAGRDDRRSRETIRPFSRGAEPRPRSAGPSPLIVSRPGPRGDGSVGMVKSVHNAIRLWRAGGTGRIVGILLRLALSPFVVFGRVVFFVCKLDAEVIAPPKLPPGIKLSLASLADLSRLVA